MAAVHEPLAVRQVGLGIRTYVPVAVALGDPPLCEALVVPVNVTAQPGGFVPAAIVAEILPDPETVPENVPTEPDIGPSVPLIVPPVIVNLSGPLAVPPADCPPIQVPLYAFGSVSFPGESDAVGPRGQAVFKATAKIPAKAGIARRRVSMEHLSVKEPRYFGHPVCGNPFVMFSAF